MEKEEVREFLENKLAEYKKKEPQAWNLHQNYQYVIDDLYNED